MSSTTTTKRRKALIDPEVQGGVLRKIAIHWVLFFICNAVALMIWIRLFEQPDADWSQTFGDTLRRFLPFFVITLALIPAFVWDTLKLTNRFAGPIHRLRVALADASSGNAVTPLQFRTNDFWKEIAHNFNTVMERCHVPMNEIVDEE
jgi:methyl-accepting chemotaxis protein